MRPDVLKDLHLQMVLLLDVFVSDVELKLKFIDRFAMQNTPKCSFLFIVTIRPIRFTLVTLNFLFSNKVYM